MYQHVVENANESIRYILNVTWTHWAFANKLVHSFVNSLSSRLENKHQVVLLDRSMRICRCTLALWTKEWNPSFPSLNDTMLRGLLSGYSASDVFYRVYFSFLWNFMKYTERIYFKSTDFWQTIVEKKECVIASKE